jgi:hypothetical protein
MKTSWLCAVAAILAIASPVSATGPGVSLPAAVPSYFAPRENGVDFILPGVSNPMACSMPGTFRVLTTAQNYNAIASSIITAFSTQKKMEVWAYQCDTDGVSLVVAAFVFQ